MREACTKLAGCLGFGAAPTATYLPATRGRRAGDGNEVVLGEVEAAAITGGLHGYGPDTAAQKAKITPSINNIDIIHTTQRTVSLPVKAVFMLDLTP